MRGHCSTEQMERCPLREHFSDTDHILPQRYKKLSWLIGKYIGTPTNKQQLCRWEHVQKTDSPQEELQNCLPSEEHMVSAITNAFEEGVLYLRVKDQQRLAEYQERLQDAPVN